MVERSVKAEQGELFLPPGFRFHPTDEEIITIYLLQKFLNPSFNPRAVGEVDLNKSEPWDLPSKAKMGEKEWYFFCHKDMKYPTGLRTNRATKEGYWKATGKDREIFKPAAAGGGRELVGMKKTLVFYMGRAPKGSKTNWVMHEFRLEGKSRDNHSSLRFNPKDEWVVCKVFHKKGEDKKVAVEYYAGTPNVSSVSVDGGDGDKFLDSMIDTMFFNSANNSLPDTPTMNAAAAYNGDHTISSAAVGTTTRSGHVGTLVDLPNYSFMNNTTTSNLHQVVVPSSTVPRSSSNSASWNMLHADQSMASYNLHHQAVMAKALGGVIAPNSAGVSRKGLPSSSVTRVLQKDSVELLQQKIGNYGHPYDSYLSATASTASTATIGPSAKNSGARLAHY